MRFHTQGIARGRIEHPRRNCQDESIVELNDVAILGTSPKPPHNVTFMGEERMMTVADSHWRR